MIRVQRNYFLAVWALALVFSLGAVWLSLPLVVTAQNTGNLTINENTAKVAYSNGVEFKLFTTVSGNQPSVNSVKLKIRFGNRGKEVTYDATINGGLATFFASEDKTQIVTGMPLIWVWQVSNGKVNYETPPATIVYEDQTHRWYQRDGDKVTVRWYSGDEGYGNLMYQLAADSLATYKRRFSMDTTEQIYISIYDRRAAFFRTFPNHPSWAGGFARYGGQEIVVISPQAQDEGVLIGEGIPHELSHAALFQFLGRPAPVWLDEGFAVYNQNIIAIREYDEVLQKAYRDGALHSFATLSTRWPAEEDAARLAYAQGRSFITFLINSYGNEVWSNMLDSLRRTDSDGAFQENFGVTLTQMEEIWRERELGRNKSVAIPAARKRGPVASQPSRNNMPGSGNNPPTGVAVTGNADNWGLLAGIGGAVLALAVTGSVVFVAMSNRKQQQVAYIAPNYGQYSGNSPEYQPVADWQAANFGSTSGYNPYPYPPAPSAPPSYLPDNMLSTPASWSSAAPVNTPPPGANAPVYFASGYPPLPATGSYPPQAENPPPVAPPAPAPVYDDPFDLIMQNFNKKPPPPANPGN